MVVSIGIIIVLLFERYLLTNPDRQENMKEAAGKIWEGIKNMDRPAGDGGGQNKKTAIQQEIEVPIYESSEHQKETGFWECSCGSRNSATSTYCSVCYKGRPKPGVAFEW